MNFRQTLHDILRGDLGNQPITHNATRAHESFRRDHEAEGWWHSDTAHSDKSITTVMTKFSDKYEKDSTGKYVRRAAWPIRRITLKTYVNKSGQINHESHED